MGETEWLLLVVITLVGQLKRAYKEQKSQILDY